MTPAIWKTHGDSQDPHPIGVPTVEQNRAIVFVGVVLFLLGFAFGVVMRDVVLPWPPSNLEPLRTKISAITGSTPTGRLSWIAGRRSTLRINLGL